MRTLSRAEHYRVLAFAQLAYRESPRDIEACLSAQSAKLCHMDFRAPVKRSTLADANERRDWRIYAEFAQRLISQARKPYAEEDLGLGLSNTVYALDSTTIDLCLTLFPWTSFRSTKTAVKIHTLLDLRDNIPSFLHVSSSKVHDVNILGMMIPEPAAIYVMDRAYLDFERLYAIHRAGLLHHPRQPNANLRRAYSAPNRTQGIVCSQTVALSGFYSHKHFPHHLCRVRFRGAQKCRAVEFTRRDKPVAVLVGRREYERLTKAQRGFGEAYWEFADAVGLAGLGLGPGEVFGDVRDETAGREVWLQPVKYLLASTWSGNRG